MKEIKDKLDKINSEIQPLKPWVVHIDILFFFKGRGRRS